ncbi:nucleoside diphosphate kinase homolog 7-like isoform X2 [Choristoneura fumiferana]|uniref:nucleoside diphosphate kinase homolog 7-like isoform X2 n=1 Tax=Choristoneura fumiferana TaxID=7141 RepID=UPI003D1542FB
MVYDYFDKYTFLCEMYNEEADAIVDLVLHFFPFDNSIQVIDTTKGKNLLRRTQIPPLTLQMLQVGNIVNIFAKLLYIKDCAPLTKKILFNKSESTFALIKPCHPSEHGKYITFIMKQGFRIVRMKNCKISNEFAKELYKSVSGSNMMPIIIDYVTGGEVIGLELVAPEAVKKWRNCLGANDPADAAPGTLRALYGKNKLENVAHGCNTHGDAQKILEMFFGYENGIPMIPFRATFKNCTCCIIKPHAIIDGNLGAILEQIATSDKFYVSAMAMFSVKIHNAQEFFEVYKGVLQEYEDLCRQLYPDSIRALYGKDIIHNAVHCTDLPEDGEQEVEYFFKLLATD